MKTRSAHSYKLLKSLFKYVDFYEKTQKVSRNPKIRQLELTVRSLNLQRMP